MSHPSTAARPWERIEHELARAIPPGADRGTRMQAFVRTAWNALASTGVSWLGFYERDPADDTQLLLAAREPRPACSPIGLHGACGQSLRAAKPLVVRDVAELGAGYIACDPRDLSEVVVPCLEAPGRAWGVLDLDSHDLASFSEADAAALAALLRKSGLSA